MDGKTISHYRILSTLGAGGMGVVYLAEDQVLHRRVALKVLRPEAVGDEAHRARFLQEARSAAALNHPHIATIYEASEADGTLFIAMEFIEGRDLRKLLAAPLPLPQVLDLATQIAEGLAHAHSQGVVHRDLKPENVLVNMTGRAKILDFGLAKLTDPAGGATLTSMGNETLATTGGQLTVQGQVMGTPAYMSPEQARGQEVDFRSDIFSFGSTLYEMCTGRQGFSRPTPIDTLSAVLTAELPPVSRVATGAPAALEDILARCLEKEPARRYANTGELVADLRAVDLTAKRRRPRRVERRKIALMAGAVLALGAVVGAGVWWRSEFGTTARATGGRARDFILVADFEGSSPELTDASRELVAAALAQSSIVTPLSRAQVQRGIRMAQLPDSTRVLGEVARELAYRATARAYIGGRVDHLGSSYSILLNVVDAKSRTTLHVLNAAAKSEGEFIGTMEDLSRQLRQKLGESRAAVRSTGRLREIITPSFEAFQYFVRGVDLHRQRKFRASNTMLRQALALDPDFASAEKLRALNYSNLGLADSARTSYEAALRRPGRLTEAERLDLRFFDARVVRYDLQDALAISDALVKLPQVSTSFLSNRSTVQFNLGRYEDALATQDSAIAISLFGASELLRLNNFKTLMQVGRYDAARAARDSLRGANRAIASLEYAVCREDWPTADQLAAELQAGEASPDVRFQARLTAGARAVQRGALGTAARDLEAAIAQAPDRFWADVARTARVELGIFSGALVPATAPFLQDTTFACVIVRGIAAAAARDTAALAAALRNTAARRGPDRLRYAGDLQLLEAWTAASADTLVGSLAALDSACTRGTGPWFSGRLPARWLLANSYAQAGRIEDAIRAYELVLDSRRLHQDAWMWWPLARPFAQLRLAELHAKSGRRAQAESRAREVLDNLKEPDSQGARLAAEAKSVLAGSVTPP